jgi:hypothetical protein
MQLRRIVAPALALTLITGVARAVTLTPMTLEEVTAEAARIVHGTVTQVTSASDDGGVPATWVTVAVATTLKGARESTITFKQAGTSEQPTSGGAVFFDGFPRYREGDEMVLFLRGESRFGFTSPVGLGQGAYRVDRASGHPEVRPDTGSRRRQDLDSFLRTVAGIAARGK